jgi:hypothetical protein
MYVFLFSNIITARPPTMENQEVDSTSQAIKRRLPREIKLKLAKVARLAVLDNSAFLMLCIEKYTQFQIFYSWGI